jgi:hypothetical protein
MSFMRRAHGTWCLILPLKFGVGLSACLVFLHGIVGIVALVADDVRFQPNGYNPYLDLVPTVVNLCGLAFGMIGLLGAYDEKPGMLWWFNRFLWIKLAAMLAAAIADMVSLKDCDSWKDLPAHESSPRLDALSQAGICPWARWSYAVGCVVDIGIWAFLTARSYAFERQILFAPPYEISFERDISSKAHLRKYMVSPPDKAVPRATEDETPKFYGSTVPPEGAYGPSGNFLFAKPATVPVQQHAGTRAAGAPAAADAECGSAC